jgi:hypothetical protein
MKWQRGPGHHQYTLTTGGYEAHVWYQPSGEWAALISRNDIPENCNFFKNVMDAQTWCETRLAEMQASKG